MPKNFLLGFPRIGEKRELKKMLESYWSGAITFEEVENTTAMLRERHWNYQKNADIENICVNDFSYYDTMLDPAIMLNAIPRRFADIEDETVRYFTMARGDQEHTAMEMTKWFNTNYHYIVPELSVNETFQLNAAKILKEYREAAAKGFKCKINLIGPITFLALSKSTDESDPLSHFNAVSDIYAKLITELHTLDNSLLIQMDEPIFSTDCDASLFELLKRAYERFGTLSPNIIVSTYFDHASEALSVLAQTPVFGIALDFVYGKENLSALDNLGDKHLIAGVVDGRNIWKNDMDATLKVLDEIAQKVDRKRISISSSCSLLHVPYSLMYEEKLDSQIKNWLSFAVEKLDEIALLAKCFHNETLNEKEKLALQANRDANTSRRESRLVHDAAIQTRIHSDTKTERDTPYKERITIQREALGYPDLATTTIGSFPQTPKLRQLRRDFKSGRIDSGIYQQNIKAYIDECVAFQEEIGLDVLVHGEPERNDMVEYFGEQLQGFAFSQNGWVQSYGSRCVKPPIIYGDVSRPNAMTIEWTTYAQSKTKKVMKGMLTGPVTILNWSFVRNDIARDLVAKQIAFAINDEVCDLQDAGIKIIQVDEAAFKEGYPMRKSKVPAYEAWALESFKISVAGAKAQTQIHTHMCYSEFNDIIKTIEAMDTDVISIETARSGNKLLKIFKEVGYKQEIGPGVYDIHSSRIPSVEEMAEQIKALLEVLPKEQLWINPDCGLKTRRWEEVKPSLINMVKAVHSVRESYAG